MAEPQKQQMGDGSDNIGQAAGQAAKAAKNAGKQAAKQAAKKGAEAAANAAAATVKAGVEGGKAVAEIAAGTAAGGPWGAIISAAWAMRHTLFKILVCLCLSVVFLIVMIVELPGIIINKALGLDGNEPTVSITEIYENLSETVSDIVQAGYDASMAEVERLISDGGYDRELSMNALINYAQSSAGYDTAYILSAYSTSVEQLSNDPEDMKKKLDDVAAKMFPVTSVERENEVITPVTYYTYKPVTITVVTKTVKTGVINGVPQYRYETAEATYYLQNQQLSSDTQIEVDAYAAVTLTLPVYSGGNITGTRKATYYQYTGKETLTPEKKTVKYLECTIHPFDNTVISTAFGLDLNAAYNGLETTYGDVIHSRALALKKTLYGTAGNGSTVPLTDVELIAFLARQNCSETRKHITHDNDSVYADRNAVPPKMKTMPILGDLHEELQKNEMTKRIAVIVSRFVTGSAQSFNQQTNVDLSNKYIVLDLSELKGKLLPVGMMIALDYVWDKIKSDRTKKKAIMIDEIWQLIGAGSNRMAAEFCLEIFKVIRGFGGAAISATQDLSDFFGLEDGRYGRAIINNSKNKIILNLEPDEAEFVRDTLKLTKTEIRSITRFERGEALICSNNSKVPVIIKASKEEQEMITTDRAELEAILMERQQEAD